MIELSGRLEADEFGSILLFLARLGHSGRLQVRRWPVAGDINFREGWLVEAACGAERGLEALDALVMVPAAVEFEFAPLAVDQELGALDLNAKALGDHLAELEPRRRRVAAVLPSPSVRLCIAQQAAGHELEKITLTRRHFSMLLTINGQRTASEVIEGLPLVTGLECLADLVEAGLAVVEELAQPATGGAGPARQLAELDRSALPMRESSPPSARGWSEVAGPARGLPSAREPSAVDGRLRISLFGRASALIARLGGRRAGRQHLRLKPPPLRRISARGVVWTALGLFIVLSGASQLPDLKRELQARSPALPLQQGSSPPFADATPSGAPIDAGAPWPSDSIGTYWTANDGYHLAPQGSAGFLRVRPPVAAYGQDVTIGARFRKLNGPTGTSYGLIFRDLSADMQGAGPESGQFVVFAVSDSGMATVRRRDGDHWVTLLGPTRFDAASVAAESSLLWVGAVGNQVTIRVNGTEVSKVNDSAPASGSIGLYATGDGAEIVVDQLTLQVL